MRKSIIGGLGVGSGMAIFVAVSPPTGGVSAPSLLAWAPALAAITALISAELICSAAGSRNCQRDQTKGQRVLGVLVALVLVVIYDVVHHGRSPADLGHDQVAIDGLDYVG
jgi:hypothetical protein